MRFAALSVLAIALMAAAQPESAALLSRGENPYPIRLVRPHAAPLSAMAQLGRAIFFDTSLSASGRQSCASCHDPSNHYGPAGDRPAMLGGPNLRMQGDRAVPSLAYLERQPPFSIGPDKEEDETASLAQMVAAGRGAVRAEKTATDTAPSAAAVVPQGGLFWDGRVDTLQQQALHPMLNPVEMAGGDAAAVADRLRHAAYANRIGALFGAGILSDPARLVSEAMFAVARYQIEDVGFHSYTSKFDFWLEERARFSRRKCAAIWRSTIRRGAIAAAAMSIRRAATASPRGSPTDSSRRWACRATGGWRTRAIHGSSTLGCAGRSAPTCGTRRSIAACSRRRRCATWRLAAASFTTECSHSLRAVLDFYNDRDVAPDKVYRRGADGQVVRFDDIPAGIGVTSIPPTRHSTVTRVIARR